MTTSMILLLRNLRIISPKGKVLKKLPAEQTSIERISIDLKENSDWYLSQNRNDVVQIMRSN